MPIYDYDCAACGRRMEVVHGVHAPGPTHCPNCGGGPLKKAIAAAAVHFKGSGWAKRDRRAKVSPGAPKATAESPAPTDVEGGDAKSGASSSSSEGDSNGAAEKPAATPSKATGAGTATKTD